MSKCERYFKLEGPYMPKSTMTISLLGCLERYRMFSGLSDILK